MVTNQIIYTHIISGKLILAGLIKIDTTKKEAKGAYIGINPFTGKTIQFRSKPAKTVVKVHALKGPKDMARYTIIRAQSKGFISR
ncbi:MAG: hypothetical protein HOM90_00075 [Porticoccaceae bacterium]|jgi:hypothetical protein|nr:hypothetical protein [Porticoccaceae bacterium]MBT4212357.1 hypothetical protein [Porticoccaceae bacterium]MBT4591517.1 hypothetical protein [Porticoccaceae bacterium]MBT5002872.1 hypothetical protein [Porticoccaceae bacterium]MBT5102929.1 hypothetical protein [Porticoccaceae bacterium]